MRARTTTKHRQPLQMMNPFLQVSPLLLMFPHSGHECKQRKKNNWSCYRRISTSRKKQRVFNAPRRTVSSRASAVTLVARKQIQQQKKKVCQYENDFKSSVWSGGERAGMAEENNWVETWAASSCDFALMRHILEDTEFTAVHLPRCLTGPSFVDKP